MPLHNKALYVRRAIDSILKQTHHAFELIVINDGSTDASWAVVQTINDPRIRLFSQHNAGASAARNRGVAEARAEVIAFLDADDEWHKDFLESVLLLREQFPEAAVWGAAYGQIMANGESVPIKLSDELREQRGGVLIDFFRESLVQQSCNCSSMLVDREAFEKVGGFRVGLVWLEDTDLLFRLALRHPIAYLPQIKSVYHMEAKSRTSQVVFSGDNPFAGEAREFFRNQCNIACIDTMPARVQQYVGYYQTAALYSNWLAGNRKVLQQIISDCWGIRGYRMKCLLWRGLSRVPTSWLILARWAYCHGRGRVPSRLCIRNTFRPSTASLRCRDDSATPVSIVIPLYNKAPQIRRALSSVFQQTMQNFECIVVDDGSTDGGGDIVQGMKDPRIRLLRQPNGGVSLARNRGIELARYPLVAFLDADDEWAPDFLQQSARMHRQHPDIVACFSNYQRAGLPRPTFADDGQGPTILSDYFAFCLSNSGLGMWTSTVTARQEALVKIGGFPVGRKMGEDLDTWARLAWRGRIGYLPTVLATYHFGDGVCAQSAPGAAQNERDDCCDILETYLVWSSNGRVPAALAESSAAYIYSLRLYAVYKSLCTGHPEQAPPFHGTGLPRLRHSTVMRSCAVLALGIPRLRQRMVGIGWRLTLWLLARRWRENMSSRTINLIKS
jgi:glycosyltransferase involved in cell wall biosynthesis